MTQTDLAEAQWAATARIAPYLNDEISACPICGGLKPREFPSTHADPDEHSAGHRPDCRPARAIDTREDWP